MPKTFKNIILIDGHTVFLGENLGRKERLANQIFLKKYHNNPRILLQICKRFLEYRGLLVYFNRQFGHRFYNRNYRERLYEFIANRLTSYGFIDFADSYNFTTETRKKFVLASIDWCRLFSKK